MNYATQKPTFVPSGMEDLATVNESTVLQYDLAGRSADSYQDLQDQNRLIHLSSGTPVKDNRGLSSSNRTELKHFFAWV